jgi:subfamily B ATP-binding cassette protein MsbA
MEAAESRRFEREGRNLTAAQTQIEMIDAATNPALEVLAILAASGFVLFGASRVFAHELEPHLFFAAVICLAGVFDPIRKLGNVNNRLHAADASANRLFELMDLAPETTAAAPAVARPEITGAVAFDGVSFAYGPDRPLVLRDVSFSAAPGEMLAIVGPNGSGKTTLVSLLLRFYEPSAGRILIDGQELRTFSLEQLRGCIGYVTQEAIVFSATLRENIAYGENGIPEERIRHAARAAHVEDFAGDLRGTASGEATCGYDAGISARTLSGGQRQRIALARAILRDPPILILDEATSQVDSESERKIQEALDTLTRNRTTFIIAHRFSTIAKADRIAVLNEGRLVGLGRHAELLESCPLYQSLCQTQFAHGA